MHYLDSYKYNPVAYWNFLAQELIARRPIYYSGSAMNLEGHAFVLDGLDANGLFHVNWGYYGSYDGYFRLDVLAVKAPHTTMTHLPTTATLQSRGCGDVP